MINTVNPIPFDTSAEDNLEYGVGDDIIDVGDDITSAIVYGQGGNDKIMGGRLNAAGAGNL